MSRGLSWSQQSQWCSNKNHWNNKGLLVNIDNNDNLEAFDLLKILKEDSNSAKEDKAQGEIENENVDYLTPLQLKNKTWVYEEKSWRVKRWLTALLNSIPSFLVKSNLPLFTNLISAEKPHVATEFTKNLITDAHHSIY